MCHSVALPFTLKFILRQKEELWKLKLYFTMQKYNLQKKLLKATKILQDIITSLKFQHKPKYHLSKILISKIDLLLLPRGRNPLSYYTLQWI